MDNYQFAKIDDILGEVMEMFRPPPDMTVSEWADEFRYLSEESSASPGRFRTSVVEYLREPMDMVGQAGVLSVTLMTSAQVGKSTFVENIIGYFIHHDPCPILHVSPTLDSMKMFSKERLAPMVRDTPVLRSRVKESRSRDSGNTLSSKKFPGGHIAMVGSNAPAGLASRPVRVLLADEVDRFEESAGTEGDPLDLAIKRTTTYWNRVIAFVSTPGDKQRDDSKRAQESDEDSAEKGARGDETDSRIEKAFLEGDQRYRWCPCPHCGEHQRLIWGQVRWEGRDAKTAYYECEHNGCVWDDQDRIRAVRAGEWRAEKEFNGHVSYHLSQLYSPFARLADGVQEFLTKKNTPGRLKTWVNTFLGETWEQRGKRLEWSDLLDHRSKYNTRNGIPEEVTLITSATDVQDDRLETEFVGWGDDMKSWSLGYHVIYGDLSTPSPWIELRELLGRSFEHPIFGELVPRSQVIDSGGHYTQSVYNFATKFGAELHCVAIKGVPGVGKPIYGRPMQNTIGNAHVIPFGVDTIKQIVTDRLKVNEPDDIGFCAFPLPDEGSPVGYYDDAYFRGLTAEELRTKYRKGFAVSEWTKVRPRNEPFDVRVYNTGALDMLNVDLEQHRRQALLRIYKRDNPEPKQNKKQAARSSKWADSWKNG
jgi:phage terminase large subunit GpA-like protein